MSINQEAIVTKYTEMGFPLELVILALEKTNGKDEDLLTVLISISEENNKLQSNVQNSGVTAGINPNEDVEMNKAIEASLKEAKNMPVYEPLNPEQRIRKSGFPVGLKNVGNTCYVNSLFQTYFMSHIFAKLVLEYDPEVKLPEEQKQAPQAPGEKDVKRTRIEASIKLMGKLQKLYASMIKSNKKYIDPTEVLHTVVDNLGQAIPIGDQKDVSEYHLNFLSRVEEALFYQEKYQKSKQLQDPSLMQIEDIPEGYTEISHKKSDDRQVSLISNIFFGNYNQFLSFNQEGQTIVEEEFGEFGPLILDVTCGELYSSLERYTEAYIDGYRTPKGEITTAKNNIWIKKLPETIFFQLQRVDFDKESGNPVKKNDTFTFEKEIYLDRFLLENKEEATNLNQEISSLRAKLSHKVEALDKIKNYLKSDLDIIRVLTIGTDFLKNQLNDTQASASDPTILGDLGNKQRIQDAFGVLEEYKNKLEKATEELKETVEAIKKQIHELNCRLCKHKYHLVSVLIHDGHAGSGHYYSFNRNVKTDTWKKYNDIQITEEKEDLVFKEAFGGYANVSAYCMVYMSDAQIQAELEASKAFEAIEIENPVEKVHYHAFLTPKLLDEVEADNCVFKEEIEEYKFSSYLKSITDNYKTRFDHLEKELKNVEQKRPPKDFDTFGAFLKKDPNGEKFFKWYLVDTVLRDSQHKMTLQELKNSPKLRLLENRLNSLSKPYGFNQLKLDNTDEAKYESKLQEFKTQYPVVVHCKYLLVAALEENWLDVCYNAKSILDLEKNQASFNYKFLKDCIKTLVLKLALYIERDATGGKIENAIQQIGYLTAMMKGVLTADDPFFDQVRIILTDAMTRSKELIDEESHQKLKQEVYKYSTAQFTVAELTKIIKEYKQQKVEDEIEAAKADIYTWKEISETSPSSELKKLMDSFIESVNQKIIPFRTKIGKDKPKLKYEDRKKDGFYYDASEVISEKKE